MGWDRERGWPLGHDPGAKGHVSDTKIAFNVQSSREARRQSTDINLQGCRVWNKLLTIRIPPTTGRLSSAVHAISAICHVNIVLSVSAERSPSMIFDTGFVL